jgi:hypothetical protein
MNKKNEYRERIRIAQWPELERKMGIIARMTSDHCQDDFKKKRIRSFSNQRCQHKKRRTYQLSETSNELGKPT